ncbi:cilia- and flagella-associated protein 58 isoform X2 [Biomphalaria glabrata]|nr:cilia- and flagella-associated protein 58 isoform X2 [Biomphalaria glabrata]
MISQLRKALATIKEYRCYIDMLRRKRDLFGARLIESNIHVGLFKRKIDRIEKVMKTSASDYLNMNNDSYMLKLEIKNLRRKLKNHEMCEFTITTLRQELSKTAKLLELEKARNVALVATKEPIVHRWRALLALTAEINMNIYDLEKKALNAIRNNKNWIKAKLKLLYNKENISSNLQKKPLPPIAVKSMSCTGSKLRVFKPTLPLLQMFN